MTQTSIHPSISDEKEASCIAEAVAKPHKKAKATVCLTKEAEHALDELYISRYRKNRKIDKSTIISEAIVDFYQRENG